MKWFIEKVGPPGSGTAKIFSAEAGREGPALALLHGFGLNRWFWEPIADLLDADPGFHGRKMFAYDLPGHGLSPSMLISSRTADMAETLIEDLTYRHGLFRLHLVGHSMGGAVACVVALKKPSLVASLTLLAPGGFGPQINADLLRRFASAQDAETLRALLSQFYGSGRTAPEVLLARLLEDRDWPGGCEELVEIADSFLKAGEQGDEQGVLPLDALAALDIPVTVIWGEEDCVVPVSQARALARTHPGAFDVHIYKGVGHSIADEIPDEVVRLILTNAG